MRYRPPSFLISIPLIAILVLRSTAYGISSTIPITQDNKNAAVLLFDITAKTGDDGNINFRVVVSEKTAKFCTNPEVSLSTVMITNTSKTIEPVRKLKFERTNNSVVCTFYVTEASIDNPDFCFVFTNYNERTIDGKVEPVSSADFIYARLKDFVNRQ